MANEIETLSNSGVENCPLGLAGCKLPIVLTELF